MNNLREFFHLLQVHKLKLAVMVVSLLVFLVILFPFDDVSDLVSLQVANLTQNQVFIQFDKMHFSILPRPGIGFDNISIDTPTSGVISAKQMMIFPSPSALFRKTPSGIISAKGLFKGEAEISVTPGKKSDQGTERQKIEITASHLNIQDLKDVGQLPFDLNGQLDLQGVALADLSFQEQPEADITIKTNKFEIPSQTINSMMGPINIPNLKIGTIELKGQLKSGRLTLEECRIGNEGDEIQGMIKGGIAVSIQNQRGIQTMLGPYSFDIDLTFKPSIEDRLSLFLTAVSQFRIASGSSGRYRFRITSQSLYMPPSMTALK